jgi:hypothetical protein
VRSNTAITRFIIDHPTISHLSLGKFCKGPNSFQFDENQVSEDSLPNLRSFEGFPMNITLLVRCNVRSLLELTTLSLSSDLEDPSLTEMSETVESSLGHGHFPYVRNLRFEFHTNLSHRMETNLSDLDHRRWIDRFSGICPAVVNWYGRLGPVNRVSAYSQALSLLLSHIRFVQDYLENIFSVYYEQLESISLPRLSMNLYVPAKDSGFNSYFHKIAEKYPRLRQVVARRPAYTELEDYVFYLRRGPDGGLDSVYTRYRDGGEDEWNLVDGEE